jgi:hypothetical protein
MIARGWLLVIALALLAAPAVAVTPSVAHYTPQAGDHFGYYETWYLNQGTGNYSGYSEFSYINGTVSVTAVAANGTEAASYSNTDTWGNVTGAYYAWTSSGTFTFSATTYHYVQGTDNQTGYVNPYVWFYIDNTATVGATVNLLNTACEVIGTNVAYPTALSSTGYAATIETIGNGTFQRNDIYGAFDATYTWTSYFDPSTGYVVGYLYVEHDVNGANGFTITDTVRTTSTSYPLTATSGPASGGSGSSGLSPTEWIAIIAVVVIVIVVVIAVIAARSRRSRLPRHSAGGAVSFGPAPPPMGAPPPVHLTPSGQPAVQQIVIRETVKVPCRYCGTLMDSTATVCPSCGAPRT